MSISVSHDELNHLARRFAKLIAPYVADELAHREQPAERAADYDAATCRAFVRELGDTIVVRGEQFFGALAERGELTSLEVSQLLGLPNQRSIGSNLTVSLSKRIKALDLPEPWTVSMTPDGERTIWRDRDGTAKRMHAALEAEISRRGLNSNGVR